MFEAGRAHTTLQRHPQVPAFPQPSPRVCHHITKMKSYPSCNGDTGTCVLDNVPVQCLYRPKRKAANLQSFCLSLTYCLIIFTSALKSSAFFAKHFLRRWNTNSWGEIVVNRLEVIQTYSRCSRSRHSAVQRAQKFTGDDLKAEFWIKNKASYDGLCSICL